MQENESSSAHSGGSGGPASAPGVALSAPPARFRGPRLLAGGALSLVAFLVGFWAASKALQALLMAIVWVVQASGSGPSITLADPLLPLTDEMRPDVAQAPSAFALQALIALGWTALGAAAVWALMWLRRRAMGWAVESSLARFVASRYLLPRQRKTLVSLITIISVLGIAVGVTALIVVISVIQGFDRVLVERTMGIFSHVEVWPRDFERGLTDYEKVLEQVRRQPGVVAASPIITKPTFFQRELGVESFRMPGVIRGLDPAREPQVTTIMDNILEGTGIPGDGEVVVGSELARRLRIQPGSVIWAVGKVVSSPHRGPAFKLSPLKVVGVFSCGLYDIDSNFVYTTLETVQKLFVMRDVAAGKDSVSVVHMKISNADNSFEVKSGLLETLRGPYLVRAWQEINPQFFEALRMEKMAMFVILLLIVLVASFNIIGTLIMVVSQKTREIGILKSMGATRTDILRIFLFHGLIIGVTGSGLGLALGLRLCWFVENHIEKIYQLPGNVYYGLDRLPVDVEPVNLAMILGASLVISLVASIIPAVQASRLDPVEALRYE